jgi:hypothetical protein
MTILTRCKPGGVWELTLDEVSGNVLGYTVSKNVSGECLAGGVGKLILRPDGPSTACIRSWRPWSVEH